MKKVLVVGLATIALAGLAFGSSLSVPFFLDEPSNPGFIGIINTTSDAIVVGVDYRDGLGVIRTPGGTTATQTLPASPQVAFSPGRKDSVSEGTLGAAFPDMTGFADVDASGTAATFVAPLAGSARLSWQGGPSDVVGRYVGFFGGFAGSSHAYLLPPGAAAAP